MLWNFIEFLFLINLITLLKVNSTKETTQIKKYITLFVSLTLSAIFFSLLLFNLKILYIGILPYITNNMFSPIIFSLDNLTTIFCFLTTLLISICVILTWDYPTYSSSKFLLIIWLLEWGLIHTFCSLNLLSFYIFFEITLIPMMLLILIWGSRQRKTHAAYMFFFYTAFGSLFLLFGILFLYHQTHTLLTTNLSYINIDLNTQKILWILFFIGFGAKVPIVPLHTWLPEAHVEAPTVGSIILAGLLLKVGTFGMVKFMFPLLNSATVQLKPIAILVALISIYHASIIALRQVDYKKIIAYSSISHMGFVILGLFSQNMYGFLGAIFIMFSHGLVASALFFSVGCIYERYKSKNLLDYGGLAQCYPNFSIIFFFLTLANISFPGTSNFIGEFLSLVGLAEINIFSALLATFSIVLTSGYSIWLFNRLIFGKLNINLIGFYDLNKKEIIVGILFVFLILLFGFQPNLIFYGIDHTPFFYLNSL